MLPPGTLVPSDSEHRRAYRSMPVNPGQEHAPGSPTGWNFSQGLISVVPHGQSPPVSFNGQPWSEPWPRLESGGQNYLAVSARAEQVWNEVEGVYEYQWGFALQALTPVGLAFEVGRVYGGSIRVYAAPGHPDVRVNLYRHLCQADEDAGGLLLKTWPFLDQAAEPWPVGRWSRVEIPTVLCDVAGLAGIRFSWTGPNAANRYGPIGVDNFVLVDVSPGARRSA